MDIEFILKFISPITVGLLAAFFASKFALYKFKNEKVWNDRREAYKEAIEAFEELIHWAEQVRASHCCEPTIGGEAKFNEALRKISKFSATGMLIFSHEFHSILSKMNTEISQIRFKVNEESQPDLQYEQLANEWDFTLANEIRHIIETDLPNLIQVAVNEIPKRT